MFRMILNNPDPRTNFYWPAADLYKEVTGKKANKEIIEVTHIDCREYTPPSGDKVFYITPPSVKIHFNKDDISEHSIQALITTLISAIPVDMSNFFSDPGIEAPFEFTNRMLKNMIITGAFQFSDSEFTVDIRFNSRFAGVTASQEEAFKLTDSMIDILRLYLTNAAAKYKDIEKSLDYSICRFDFIVKEFNDAMDIFKKFLLEENKDD